MTEPDYSSSTATPRNAMSEPEVAEFLSRPLTAALATIDADGTPHLTPVWFGHEAGRLFFMLGTKRRHLRNLRRDPRATLLVDVDERRSSELGEAKAVMASGAATLVDDPATVQRCSDLLDERYLGTTEYVEGAPAGEDYVLVWLDPSRWLTWDFGKAQTDAG